MQIPWRKASSSEKGFTLFEVVVAGFVAILFFLLVLQASTLNTVSKTHTQEASEVLNWLHQDIEFVKNQASTLHLATIQAANKDDKKVYLNNPEDELQFQYGDIIEFINSSPDGVRYTIKKADHKGYGYFSLAQKLEAVYPPNSYVIVRSRQQALVTTAIAKGSQLITISDTSNLDPGSELMFGDVNDLSLNLNISQQSYKVTAVSSNAITVKTQLTDDVGIYNTVNIIPCNPTRKNLGYADILRDQLVGTNETSDASIIILDPAKTVTSKGKKYMIKRVMELVDIPPYNLLQVRYETMPQLPDAISLSSYVARILPDIVLYCN